jgi:hypothetical protein
VDFLVDSSLADEFPFRFTNLLIETIIIGTLFGFAILSSDLLDEIVFVVEGVVLLLIGIYFELAYGGRKSSAISTGDSTRTRIEGTAIVVEGPLEDKPLIDKRLARNITKAFSLSAVALWLVAGIVVTDNPFVSYVSQVAFIVVVLFFPFGVFLGLLQVMRNPRVSASQAFGAYINLGMLLIAIPLIVLLLFVVGAVTLLVFIPPSGDPAQLLLTTLLISVVAMAILQGYFVISTLQRAADYHGLSISGYIMLKLSEEEKERQKQAKIARAKKAARLYEAIPQMKKKIRPWEKDGPQLAPPVDMSEYEYAQSSSKLRAIIRELGPALLAILAADAVFIAFFLAISSMQ